MEVVGWFVFEFSRPLVDDDVGEHGLDDNFLGKFEEGQFGQFNVMLFFRDLQSLKVLTHNLHNKTVVRQWLSINFQQILIPDKQKHNIKLWISLLNLYPLIQLLHAPEHLQLIIFAP